MEAAGRRGRLEHNPALDGLRALAALGICAYHAGFDWASGGFLSVSAFFTLSGFLITRLLLAEHAETGTLSIQAFWGRRFRRLLPPALIALGAIVLIALLGLGLAPAPNFAGDIVSALLYVANWRFIFEGYDYAAIFRAPSPVQHFWSLGIEEQFYLLYPAFALLLLRMGRGSRRPLAIGVGLATLTSALWMAWLYTPGEAILRVYFGADTRMAEIGVGALLALAFPNDAALARHRGFAVLAIPAFALMGALFVFTHLEDAWVYAGGLFLHAALTACVLAGLCVPGPLRSALATPALQYVGRISYGLYVYHWPVFLLLDADTIALSPGPLFCLRMALVAALAALSHRFVEAPIRAGTRLPGRTGGLVGTAVAVLIGVTVVGAARVNPFTPDAGEEGGSAEAPLADADGLPRVFVVGDSVGHNAGSDCSTGGARPGPPAWSPRAQPGCGVARGGTRLLWHGEVADEAGALQRGRADLVRGRRLDASGRWWSSSPGGLDLVDRKFDDWPEFAGPGDARFDAWLVAEYVELVDRLSVNGAPVVWLTWPCAEDKPLGGVHTGRDTFSLERVRHLNEVIIPAVAAARPDVVRVVDLFAYVCPDGRFTHDLGGFTDARKDGLHFSPRDARWLADWLGPVVLANGGVRDGD